MNKKEYGVFGLGKFGTSVAVTLAEAGNSVIAVDANPDRIDEIANVVTCAMVADVTDPDVLDNLGISNLDCVIVGVSTNMQASIMATIFAKEKKVPFIISKAENEIHKHILEKVGADKVVFPEAEMGGRLARNLMGGDFVDLVELSKEFSMVEIQPRSEWLGKGLRELNVRENYGLNVIGIKQNDELTVDMKPDAPLEKGMTLVIVGKNDDLVKVGVEI
ncbi:MAG: TrkA family potassium uptake protein [Clostridia bacterium]|nr:TrkA family potassium uptake protein [Lachnospiraceae bacterium]NCC00021.1 TrkA family potassium uptake protein [Clostridia bacterium]NCD01865.1 TrkA family potassium uptake protein [Clostridia bacterium]